MMEEADNNVRVEFNEFGGWVDTTQLALYQ